MFGYVKIDKMELKFREYYKYKGYYCGLCMNLRNNYSQLSRLTLNYDMTFLILILTSLYESENKVTQKRCVVHPTQKQMMIENEITDYAAAMNIILSYHKLKDDWLDEKDYKSLLFSKLLHRDYKKANQFYLEKESNIKQHLTNLMELERVKTNDLDAISNEFGYLMSELILYKQDHWEDTLRKVGFFLGKYIYILDAYLDLEKDLKNDSYNPFRYMEIDNLDDFIYDILTLNLSFLNKELDKLPLILDKGIIDNIMYSGILAPLNKSCNRKEV